MFCGLNLLLTAKVAFTGSYIFGEIFLDEGLDEVCLGGKVTSFSGSE